MSSYARRCAEHTFVETRGHSWAHVINCSSRLCRLGRLGTTTGKLPPGKLNVASHVAQATLFLLGGLSKSKMQPIQVLWQIGVHTYLSRSKTSPVTLSRRTFSRHVAYPVRLHLDSHAQHGRCFTGPGDKELNPNPNILRRNPYRSVGLIR